VLVFKKEEEENLEMTLPPFRPVCGRWLCRRNGSIELFPFEEAATLQHIPVVYNWVTLILSGKMTSDWSAMNTNVGKVRLHVVERRLK